MHKLPKKNFKYTLSFFLHTLHTSNSTSSLKKEGAQPFSLLSKSTLAQAYDT